MVHSIWSMVYGIWYMVYGIWYELFVWLNLGRGRGWQQRPWQPPRSAPSPAPLSSKCATHKTVKAKFWLWLQTVKAKLRQSRTSSGLPRSEAGLDGSRVGKVYAAYFGSRSRVAAKALAASSKRSSPNSATPRRKIAFTNLLEVGGLTGVPRS